MPPAALERAYPPFNGKDASGELIVFVAQTGIGWKNCVAASPARIPAYGDFGGRVFTEGPSLGAPTMCQKAHDLSSFSLVANKDLLGLIIFASSAFTEPGFS